MAYQLKPNELYITGKAYWIYVTNPNTADRLQRFTLDVSLDDETISKLKQMGYELPKRKSAPDERGNYVTLRSTFKPVIFDADKEPFDESVIIGKGSVVKVLAHVYNYGAAPGRKAGSALGFTALQVLELNEYKGITKGNGEPIHNPFEGSTDNPF